MNIADGKSHYIEIRVTTKDGQVLQHRTFMNDNDLALWQGSTARNGGRRFGFKVRVESDPLDFIPNLT